MESPIELLKRLIDEGEKFNFQNFCYPNDDFPGKYGGSDTPEWLAWKTRCRNLIAQITDEHSPSVELIRQGLGIPTSGNYPISFEKAKSTLLLALRTALKAVQEDTFGELHSNTRLSLDDTYRWCFVIPKEGAVNCNVARVTFAKMVEQFVLT